VVSGGSSRSNLRARGASCPGAVVTVRGYSGDAGAERASYGDGGAGHLRVSLGCPDEDLDEALRRLRQLDLTWHDDEETTR